MEGIIFLVIALVINIVIASIKQKAVEEQKKYAEINRPQSVGSTQNTQRQHPKYQDTKYQDTQYQDTQYQDTQYQGTQYRNTQTRQKQTSLQSTKERFDSTIKPTVATVHISKEQPDPHCEPHTPIVSFEGDPHYIVKRSKSPIVKQSAYNLSEMEYDNNALIRGIIYSEIFGKPKSRR